jgi:serine phosphatase RsbU (regulator of sigma subunit)
MASSALAGERESGDLHLVRPVESGVLVAVVDGLGHGEEAAAAARLAVGTLDRFAEEPLQEVVRHCHEALIGTRGVVMSLAMFDPAGDTMAWLGIGNVEGLVIHVDWPERSGRTSLVTRGGIVGSRGNPSVIRPWVIPVQPGDVLVFATDGVRSGFSAVVSSKETPQKSADMILARYGKGTDDALVLVARYLGRR